MIGDMRDHHPIAMQACATDLLDAGQLLPAHRTELLEIHHWPISQLQTRSSGSRRDSTRSLARLAPHVGVDIILRNPAFDSGALYLAQVDTQLPRELSYRGRC